MLKTCLCLNPTAVGNRYENHSVCKALAGRQRMRAGAVRRLDVPPLGRHAQRSRRKDCSHQDACVRAVQFNEHLKPMLRQMAALQCHQGLQVAGRCLPAFTSCYDIPPSRAN